MTATAPHPVVREEEQRRRRRMRAPILVIGGLTLATLALHLRDPHESGSWGFCPSAALGIYCPGCGGLRAVNDLTNGQVGTAASSNLAFVLVLPFLVAGLGWWAVARWRGTTITLPARVSTPVACVLLALLLVFTVLRNLGPGSWLAP